MLTNGISWQPWLLITLYIDLPSQLPKLLKSCLYPWSLSVAGPAVIFPVWPWPLRLRALASVFFQTHSSVNIQCLRVFFFCLHPLMFLHKNGTLPAAPRRGHWNYTWKEAGRNSREQEIEWNVSEQRLELGVGTEAGLKSSWRVRQITKCFTWTVTRHWERLEKRYLKHAVYSPYI